VSIATRRLEFRAALTAASGFAVLVAGLFAPLTGTASDAVELAACAVWLGGSAATVLAVCLRHEQEARRGRVADAMRTEMDRTEAERTLRAMARGDTVEAIKGDALRQAAALFGADADLEIVSVAGIATAIGTRNGAFVGTVTVRAAPGMPPILRTAETKAS
jgi:hypothetical protein